MKSLLLKFRKASSQRFHSAKIRLNRIRVKIMAKTQASRAIYLKVLKTTWMDYWKVCGMSYSPVSGALRTDHNGPSCRHARTIPFPCSEREIPYFVTSMAWRSPMIVIGVLDDLHPRCHHSACGLCTVHSREITCAELGTLGLFE